jgi:hypothetical protein
MKRSRVLLALAVAAVAGGIASFGQGCTSTTCEDTSTCSTAGEGGSMDGPPSDHSMTDSRSDGHHEGSADGATDVVDGGEGGSCTGTPMESPCSISEAFGIFVAPLADGGNDTTGNGSRKQPYATLGTAIPKAIAAGKRVYACGGTYAESVLIGKSVDGVEIYGGLECPVAGDGGVADAGKGDSSTGPWSYNGVAAAVAPTSTGLALDVENLTKGAHFEDMSFTAMAATASNPGESSVAVKVNGSNNVAFLRVAAQAGDGAVGAAGMALPTNMCATSLAGSGTTTNGGGGSPMCTCPIFGSTAGGAGGGGNGLGGAQGFDGGATPGTTLSVTSYDGVGGSGATVSPAKACGNGDPGANGSAQAGGLAGTAGSLASSGWQPATAGSGMPGDPGQGGGGGGGGLVFGGQGAGGGGCGGNGGGGGGGGGASLALAIIGSTVNLSAVTLQTGNGGTGGAGAQGEQGQAGGPEVLATETLQCNGGGGGQGAGGSGGGGGAGGPSIGIAWTGSTAPKVDGASTPSAMTLPGPSTFTGIGGGTGGAFGAGGLASVGTDGNSGVAGNVGTGGPAGASAAVQKF